MNLGKSIIFNNTPKWDTTIDEFIFIKYDRYDNENKDSV